MSQWRGVQMFIKQWLQRVSLAVLIWQWLLAGGGAGLEGETMNGQPLAVDEADTSRLSMIQALRGPQTQQWPAGSAQILQWSDLAADQPSNATGRACNVDVMVGVWGLSTHRGLEECIREWARWAEWLSGDVYCNGARYLAGRHDRQGIIAETDKPRPQPELSYQWTVVNAASSPQ